MPKSTTTKPPSGQPVRLADVAASAGVSISAVSRVLNRDPKVRVADSTRERILRASNELGYRPNFAGRALKSARTMVFGLVVPDISNPLVKPLLRGVEDEAEQHDYSVLLGRTEGPGRGEIVHRLLGEGRVDGILVELPDGTDAGHVLGGTRPSDPVVLIDRPGVNMSSISCDYSLGASIATQHLLKLGHTRIGLINGLSTEARTRKVREGWSRTLRDAGRTNAAVLETCIGLSDIDGGHSLDILLGCAERPTAAVVGSVHAALGLLARARFHGLDIPREFSVVSLHDAWMNRHAVPGITSVDLQQYSLGMAATTALLDLLDGATPQTRILEHPEPELIVRGSTAPPPARAPRS